MGKEIKLWAVNIISMLIVGLIFVHLFHCSLEYSAIIACWGGLSTVVILK